MSHPASSVDEEIENEPMSVRSQASWSAERARISGIREAAKEARREHRAHLAIEVRFHVVTGGGDEIVHARARNISVGGMFIETDRPAAFGTAITIELALPDMPELARLASTVRWTNADGMGVQFGVMGARETHGIVKLLEP